VSSSNPLDRRDFLLRAAKAGAAIVAAGGAGLWLHDRKGPSASIVRRWYPCRIFTAVRRAEDEHHHRATA